MRYLTLLIAALLAANTFGASLTSGSIGGGNVDNPSYTTGSSITSTLNSTTNLLSGDAVFTGGWESTKSTSIIIVTIKSDVSSATNGLCVQFSPDASTLISDDCFTMFVNGGKTFSFQPVAEYFRVSYTNGTSAQGAFDLHTQLKGMYVKPSSHRIGDNIVGEDDAELVKSAITGESPDGTWRNVQTTSDGNLAVVDRSSGLSISAGDVDGYSTVHKFGNAPDFDTDDGEITIWDGADDVGLASWENMVYNYSTTADIDSISSSDNGDTQEVTIQGLDASTNIVEFTATLNGTNKVTLGTSLYRVFRAYNSNSTEFSGHVLIYVDGPITAGVPDDGEDIRAIIQPENQQTEMAVYTIPAGKKGYIRSFDTATAGGTKVSNYIMRLFTRAPGGVFRLQKKISISDTGSNFAQYLYVDPPQYSAGTDIEMTIESIASPVATDLSVSGGFDLILVDD